MERIFGKHSKFQKSHGQDPITQCYNAWEPMLKKYPFLLLKMCLRYYNYLNVNNAIFNLWVSNVYYIYSNLLPKKTKLKIFPLIIIIIIEIKTAFKGYTFDLERATVFNGIELFRKSLKELFIGGTCTNYFSLAVLLDLVPALTHLTVRLYSYHDMTINDTNAIMRGRRPNIESNIDDNNVNYNLVFLCLYSPLRNDLDIEQIARRCPQLKYLLVSEPHTYGYLSKSPIEFTNILELCPSIRYIHWGGR